MDAFARDGEHDSPFRAAACLITGVAVGGVALARTSGPPPSSIADVLPADQPACPAAFPTQPTPGGVLTDSSLKPALATACDYDPTTKQLLPVIGQFRPVDISDFLAFIRSLKTTPPADCPDGATLAATSIQFLLQDKTVSSLTAVASAQCATISDGEREVTVSVASLSAPGGWGRAIDSALPFPPEPAAPSDAPAYTTPTAAPPESTMSTPLETTAEPTLEN